MTESAQSGPDDDKRSAIARRAHELFERRGREEGHDVADWLEAEQEIAKPANSGEDSAYAEVIPLGGESEPKPDEGEDNAEG